MAAPHPLVRLLGCDPKRVVGLVGLGAGGAVGESGGIGAALCEIHGHGEAARVRLVRYQEWPWPPGLGEAVESLSRPTTTTAAADVSALNIRLGQALAEAAATVIGDDEVDLIGSHGQTVWHQPPWMKTRADLPASTLQLGDPALIAARTGVVTVGDFRAADVAVGGAGAPLLPVVDWAVYRRAGAVRGLQKIGAHATLTVLGTDPGEVYCFDCGPGEALLDGIAAALGGAPPDGRVDAGLLARLLDDEFVARPPPKSLERGHYGAEYARRLVADHAHVAPSDLYATARAFVVEAIAVGVRQVRARAPVDELYVSGAGARRAGLLAELGARLAPTPVAPLDELGVAAEAREAVGYALLAVECAHGAPANLPSATGARRRAVLGKLCLPPQ